VQAQQAYPVSPGTVYSAAPPAYPDYRRGPSEPDLDGMEDDEAPNATALPPPGPVMSPDDPRYGRPYGAPPFYTDRGTPTGPVMSPDDPRYGRPAGPPPVYSDRNAPTGPVMSPDDPRYGRPAGPPAVIYADRPGQPQVNGAPNADGIPRPPEGVMIEPSAGADGKPITLAALPPEEQPDAAPVQLPPNLRRQEVAFVTKEPAGTIVVDTPNTSLY